MGEIEKWKSEMLIRCKKTGEEYEITDREIGERVECPCCGEKFVVDDAILPADVYTAALIRKTEAIALRDEPVQKIYKHGSEGEYARLFDKAYDEDNADAQFELAKRLCENHKEYALAAFWFECAAKKKHPEATYRLAECYWNGIGLRKDLNFAVKEYRNAAKFGCAAAQELASKFDFAEYRGNDGGGMSTFAAVQRMIGEDKKFEQYLCAKYNAKAVVLFWRDEALPEWGVPKGTSFIIGSFASEQDVPREMLNEIEHLTGRDLSYSGRYIDDGIEEKRFYCCYKVWPADEEEFIDKVKMCHISDLLQDKLEHEAGEDARRIITWRETIDMNCPCCEERITLPTRLTGSKVCCSHCSGEFWAKGDGIMTTAERKAYREEKKWHDEANKIEQEYMRADGSTVSALRVVFKMRRYSIECKTVGTGRKYPWPGVYVRVEFEDVDDDKAIRSRLVSVCETLESGLGNWLRLTKIENEFGRFFGTFYLRQDRPCEMNDCITIELQERKNAEKRGAKSSRSEEQENAAVAARENEYERLRYLIYGEYEPSRNRFDFQGFMRNKYNVAVINVFNDEPGDPFCKRRGFADGFGIVVEAENALSDEEFSSLVADVRKRISRELTLVGKMDSGVIEYCFVPSMTEQNTVKPARSAPPRSAASSVVARAKNEGGSTLKRNTTSTTPQHIGRGTGVDWTKENGVFSDMIAKHGIRKFHVEMANPYCAEVSIPMSVDEDVVRDFANDLFHALDILDEGCDLEFGQLTDCSGIDINEDGRCYYVLFNQHDVAECNPGDGKYKYKIEAITANGEDDEEADDSDEGGDEAEKIMRAISFGITSGAIRSKSGEGYFVLKGEYYDAIEAGRKTTEYRDLTPRNLSMSIGIKTVKLQRGYGHPGHPPKQMRFEVSSVRLMDASDRECDPYAIPPGFIATTIAIHLGKRMG